MKKVLIFYAVLVIVIVIFALSRGANLLKFNFTGGGNSGQTVTVGKKTYSVTIAKTEAELQKGLSGRSSLNSGNGMLFVFPDKQRYTFWMNDMKFPIDIIFINDNKVVDFVENAPAPAAGQSAASLPRYTPSGEVNYVLEVNAKEVSKNNIKKGDSVSYKNIK